MKNLIWVVVLAFIGCTPDLQVSKGQYADYCNVDSNGRLVITVVNEGEGSQLISTTRVEFGKYGFEDIATPALGSKAFVILPSVHIPAGCFDSDCSFKITVDYENVISEGESGEANNSVIGNCIG